MGTRTRNGLDRVCRVCHRWRSKQGWPSQPPGCAVEQGSRCLMKSCSPAADCDYRHCLWPRACSGQHLPHTGCVLPNATGWHSLNAHLIMQSNVVTPILFGLASLWPTPISLWIALNFGECYTALIGCLFLMGLAGLMVGWAHRISFPLLGVAVATLVLFNSPLNGICRPRLSTGNQALETLDRTHNGV